MSMSLLPFSQLYKLTTVRLNALQKGSERLMKLCIHGFLGVNRLMFSNWNVYRALQI